MRRPEIDVIIPRDYPTSTVFLDESGSKGKELFTLAGFKIRKPGEFARTVHDLRDRHGFSSELKFNRLNRGSEQFALDIVSALRSTDAHIVGTVIAPTVHDPFRGAEHRWKAHAEIATQLLVGCINRRELVSVMMDGISTPRGCSLGDTVKSRVNRRFRNTSVVSAICLDSKTNDLLQVADLVASSIRFERLVAAGKGGERDSSKGVVAAYVGAAFGNVGLLDSRGKRHNIQTLRGLAKPSKPLQVVSDQAS